MIQSQDFRDSAKADANEAEPKIMRPSRDRGRKSEAEPRKAVGRRDKAKARRAEKLPRGGLEPRQLPRRLQSSSSNKQSCIGRGPVD